MSTHFDEQKFTRIKDELEELKIDNDNAQEIILSIWIEYGYSGNDAMIHGSVGVLKPIYQYLRDHNMIDEKGYLK